MNLISYLFLLEANRIVSQVPDCEADSSSPYSLDDVFITSALGRVLGSVTMLVEWLSICVRVLWFEVNVPFGS